MKTLLRIDVSSRKEGSHSRGLAHSIEKFWKKQNPEGRVIYRDLIEIAIPHIHNTTIEGFYTTRNKKSKIQTEALELSDLLVQELIDANEVLISSPLYNLNIPSNLKAYIDHITRINYTFEVDVDGSFHGLLTDKIAYLALVKGGKYAGTPLEYLDFQEPYLKAILSYLGIEVRKVFTLEGTANSQALNENMSDLILQIESTFK